MAIFDLSELQTRPDICDQIVDAPRNGHGKLRPLWERTSVEDIATIKRIFEASYRMRFRKLELRYQAAWQKLRHRDPNFSYTSPSWLTQNKTHPASGQSSSPPLEPVRLRLELPPS